MDTMTNPPPSSTAVTDEAQAARLLEKIPALRAEIGKVIIGQSAVVEDLLTAFLAGGHCLLEGLPGLGKTLLIRTLAQAVDLVFHRIQFTPDLMPSDLIGTEVLEEDHATGRRFFRFNKGPLFGQIILADEINRTPPKTQSALLEAMQEGSITYGGQTYDLERPFFVLATQNPIEQAGTYPLPEAQLDRFLLYVQIGYPDESEEFTMLAQTTGQRPPAVTPVMTAPELLALQAMAREVAISDELLRYVARLVRATRDKSLPYIEKWVRWGAGPRAGQSLILAAKARALLSGRFAVTPADLRALAAPVLRHRLLLSYEAESENVRPDDVAGGNFPSCPGAEKSTTIILTPPSAMSTGCSIYFTPASGTYLGTPEFVRGLTAWLGLETFKTVHVYGEHRAPTGSESKPHHLEDAAQLLERHAVSVEEAIALQNAAPRCTTVMSFDMTPTLAAMARDIKDTLPVALSEGFAPTVGDLYNGPWKHYDYHTGAELTDSACCLILSNNAGYPVELDAYLEAFLQVPSVVRLKQRLEELSGHEWRTLIDLN